MLIFKTNFDLVSVVNVASSLQRIFFTATNKSSSGGAFLSKLPGMLAHLASISMWLRYFASSDTGDCSWTKIYYKIILYFKTKLASESNQRQTESLCLKISLFG